MKQSNRQKTNRDAILDATDRLLARSGYKKMTIDDLANEVGIGKGSVYLHFESKEEIALAHIDRIVDQILKRLMGIAGSDGPCDERLKTMLVDRVMIRFDSVQPYRQSLDELLASIRSRLVERRKLYFDKEAKIFASVLEEGRKKGVFEFTDAGQTALTVLDASNSLLPYSLIAYELAERSEMEKKANLVANLILKGLIRR